MLSVGPLEAYIILLLLPVIVIVSIWKIFAKAGFPGIMSLVMVVPLLNVIMLYFLAFAEWPALRERSKI